MATAQINTVIRHFRWAVLLQDGASRTDGELLASFIDEKDEAAFEALLRRHGPMVLSVCRRIIRDHHDAEDAFQATFLVLSRKASSVWPRAMVANWLHGVAYRTALKARTKAAKRHVREKQVREMPENEAMQQDNWHELQSLLDKELSGLPETYRLPILLCDLEGKSIKEAAQQLGWPQGTLAGRLARGRKMLANRLSGRGMVLSAGSLTVLLSQNPVSASLPPFLINSTVQLVAPGNAAVAGMVPAKVAALMHGVLKAMLLTKLKKVMAILVVLGVVSVGSRLLPYHTVAGQPINAEQNGLKPRIIKVNQATHETHAHKSFVVPMPLDFSVKVMEGMHFVVPVALDFGFPVKPMALDFGFPAMATQRKRHMVPIIESTAEYPVPLILSQHEYWVPVMAAEGNRFVAPVTECGA